MSLSNDHFYGHANKYIIENNVTWLECAASCLVWSTMLVYYLESPYGNLMKEILGKPQGRTKVKGNLFSFNMPWEDIEKCCHQAVLHAKQPHKTELKKLQSELGLPHSEETLALMVNKRPWLYFWIFYLLFCSCFKIVRLVVCSSQWLALEGDWLALAWRVAA